jgi:uncharacterized protein (TIGR00661 family)
VRTNGEKINNSGEGLRILIAPLDWGLGHATRCIPIIYALKNAGVTVFLAGDGAPEVILKKEFPELPFLHLQGYKIVYSKSKRSFFFKLLSQFPSIFNSINNEHKWLKNIVKEHKIDAAISDNRFGFYHKLIPSVYITHQLHIETGNRFINKIAQHLHYSYINRFGNCWVPDAKGNKNLGGLLSHTKKMPLCPVSYLGIISRFKKMDIPVINDLIVVLSGPEPQRTIFEKIIISELRSYNGSAVLVRGLPEQEDQIILNNNIQVYHYLPADELSKKIQQSAMVLARAGYTTIMDLAILKQKAILVPTPGQAEQEYLAKSLTQKQLFYSSLQENFSLEKSIGEAKKFYNTKQFETGYLNETVIINWLTEIKNTKVLQ